MATTLEEYEQKVDALIAQNDHEAAVALSDLSRCIRCMIWNARVVGDRPKLLAQKADDAAFRIAGITRQTRWQGKAADGRPYPIP